MKSKMKAQFAVLAAVPFVMVLGNSMLIPVFPQLQRAMDLTPFQVGLIITAFSLPAGLLIPFTGALSDHVGRKTVMAPFLAIYGIGGLIAGFAALLLAKPYGMVIAGRIVQGIGAGGTYQLAMALTGDIFTSEERVKTLGLLEASNGLGKVLSPILGSLVGLIAWFAPFFAYGVAALPVAALVWFVIKEEVKEENKRSLGEYWQGLKGIFKKKAVPLLASYMVGMLVLFLLFGVLSFLSDDLEGRFDIRGFRKGFVIAIPVGAMALVSYLSGFLLQNRRQFLKPVILVGVALAGISLVGAALFTGLVPFMITMTLLGISIGSTLPPINLLITGAAPTSERGLVTSLYGTVRFFGVALGPPTFGLASALGRRPMFFGAAALAGIVLVLAWFLIDPQRLLAGQKKEGRDDDHPAHEGHWV
ncbi:MAG: MFS transporter [Limnochordia bacterium]|jgi:ACDE family multidrug resistance protein